MSRHLTALTRFSIRPLLLLCSGFAMSASAVSFQSLDKGYYSGIEEDVKTVYRTRQEFATLWQTHKSNQSPVPNLPDVDFGPRMVAVLFMGQKNTGGYSIEVTSVQSKDGGGLVVNYETSSPPPGAMVTQALTQPYHIVSLDSTDGDVDFEGSVKPPPPPPTPAFIVGFDEGADREEVKRRIEDHDAMSGGSVRLTNYNYALIKLSSSDNVNKNEFQTFVESIEGVKYVEEDSMM